MVALNPVLSAGLFLGAYWLWLFFAHLIGLSLVTYGMISSSPKFNEIADLYFTNSWTVQGWAAGLFLLLNIGLTVGRPAQWLEFNRNHLKTKILPMVLRTAAGALIWVLLTHWLTPSQFLGPGFSWEEGLWATLIFVSRTVAWIGWACGEEWIFRKVLLERARSHFAKHRLGDWAAIGITTALWVLTRCWGYHLGVNQTLTLVLLGTILGLRASRGGSYLEGAAIVGVAAAIFQVLFSIPVLGQDFTGAWIIKYRSGELLQLVSGGAGGPLSSAAIQLALIGWILFKLDWKIEWTGKARRLR